MRKLVYKDTGVEVKKGDILTDFRGERNDVAHYWREPDHGVGKISVRPVGKDDVRYSSEYYVTVYGLEWREVDE